MDAEKIWSRRIAGFENRLKPETDMNMATGELYSHMARDGER